MSHQWMSLRGYQRYAARMPRAQRAKPTAMPVPSRVPLETMSAPAQKPKGVMVLRKETESVMLAMRFMKYRPAAMPMPTPAREDDQLHEPVGQVQEADFLPRDGLADGGDGADGDEEDDDVHGGHLEEDREELLRHHAHAADRMGEEEFRGALLFFLGEHGDGQQGREERAAQAEHVAALDGVVAGEGAAVELIHAEGGGEGAHGGEKTADAVHLALHFRPEEDTGGHEEGDGAGPDEERGFAPADFMTGDGHACSPPLS